MRQKKAKALRHLARIVASRPDATPIDLDGTCFWPHGSPRRLYKDLKKFYTRHEPLVIGGESAR